MMLLNLLKQPALPANLAMMKVQLLRRLMIYNNMGITSILHALVTDMVTGIS
jgi:hypothetical protein